MKASVIIPTLNEHEVLKKTIFLIPKKYVNEIVVVDGHSTDDTIKIAKSLGCRTYLQPRKGYGDAVRYGVKVAKSDVVVFMDADGSQDPKALPRLLNKIDEGYDMVLGSRYLKGAGSEDDTFIRYAGNMIFTFLVNVIHGLHVSDSLYLYAAIKKAAFKKINPTSDNMEFCVEILIKGRKKGIKIAEIPIRERKRIAGRSKVNALYHGVRILRWILKKY